MNRTKSLLSWSSQDEKNQPNKQINASNKNNIGKYTIIICEEHPKRNIQSNVEEYKVGPSLDLGTEKVSLFFFFFSEKVS